MSSIWSAVDIAGTGANVDQTWIDTIGGNIANMNDAVTPGQPVYQAQYVNASENMGASGGTAAGDGVDISSITLGPKAGEQEYDPSNPVANAAGEVEYPVVDLATQMTDLVQAQISYQSNAQVMSQAKTAYQSILDIKA
jgi:flagellar basal-body rod protein FlgC